MTKPSIGRIVHYTLTDQDAAAINKRREDARQHPEVGLAATGVVIHAGNPVQADDVYPLVITRVWNENPGTVNGVVLLDGNDTLWVTSRIPGDAPGFYAWPARN